MVVQLYVAAVLWVMADFAGVLFADAPANREAADVEPMYLVELGGRMATVLPGAWRLGQIQAEQLASGNLGRFQVGKRSSAGRKR